MVDNCNSVVTDLRRRTDALAEQFSSLSSIVSNATCWLTAVTDRPISCSIVCQIVGIFQSSNGVSFVRIWDGSSLNSILPMNRLLLRVDSEDISADDADNNCCHFDVQRNRELLRDCVDIVLQEPLDVDAKRLLRPRDFAILRNVHCWCSTRGKCQTRLRISHLKTDELLPFHILNENSDDDAVALAIITDQLANYHSRQQLVRACSERSASSVAIEPATSTEPRLVDVYQQLVKPCSVRLQAFNPQQLAPHQFDALPVLSDITESSPLNPCQFDVSCRLRSTPLLQPGPFSQTVARTHLLCRIVDYAPSPLNDIAFVGLFCEHCNIWCDIDADRDCSSNGKQFCFLHKNFALKPAFRFVLKVITAESEGRLILLCNESAETLLSRSASTVLEHIDDFQQRELLDSKLQLLITDEVFEMPIKIVSVDSAVYTFLE